MSRRQFYRLIHDKGDVKPWPVWARILLLVVAAYFVARICGWI